MAAPIFCPGIDFSGLICYHKSEQIFEGAKNVTEGKVYIAIDLKSFFASQECVARGLDPMTTNLVVADSSRTEKTICLAVTPSLKAYGIPGRARLFEVVEKVGQVNAMRREKAPGKVLTGSSWDARVLEEDPKLAVDYIVALPRMAHYMECSTRVYHVYLKYVAPEDIHVYSIDEVFIDATPYLKASGLSPREFAAKIIHDVLKTTGITATAGIGTNLYLCKVALDILAKHAPADELGVRIAQLDEMQYRRLLWSHEPLTDFWRVGRGYAKKLRQNGLYTMGDIARCSVGKETDFHNEELLYRLFGVNAQLLIDHAWGWEPCTIADIKAYRPESNSIGSGQVLHCPYTFEKAKLIAREMTDLLVLDLVDKNLVTDQIVLTVGYDIENLTDSNRRSAYQGQVTTDHYGRKVPKHAHGTANLPRKMSSTKQITEAVMALYDQIVDSKLLIRRINLTANHVIPEWKVGADAAPEQLDLFSDAEGQKQNAELEREKRRQQAVLHIRKKYGKNAILKGMNLEEGATAVQRNQQIGGHKA